MRFRSTLMALSALMLTLGSGWTYAQEDPPDGGGENGDDVPELTMRLLPPNAQAAEQALRELELPTRIDDETGEPVFIPSDRAVNRVNEARSNVENNRAGAAEAAQNNREEMGRGTMPTLPPQAPNEMPGQPQELPGPPAEPGGRP